MKGLILLANHFEDVEALITIDMLRRAKIEIDLVSITEDYNLVTQSGVRLQADHLISEIDLDEYAFLIIPGGKAVFETHLNSNITKNCIKLFYKKQKLIATICAAPLILDSLGILKDKEYVCFPSCEKSIDGIYKENEKVVVSNNIITSKAAGTTFDFAFAIIKYLLNEEMANIVLNNVYYK